MKCSRIALCPLRALSPPARGAWIEIISICGAAWHILLVAPRTGGVD